MKFDMNFVLAVGLIIMAIYTIYAVVTPNHLFIV